MARRKRLTELEAFSFKQGRRSEPVGTKGKGTLLLERKASGVIDCYYRERLDGADKREYLGTLAKRPRPETAEKTLDEVRLAALQLATAAGEVGGLAAYLRQQRAGSHRRAVQEEGNFGDLLDAYTQSLIQTGKVSGKRVQSLFKCHVVDHHPDLLALPATEIRPEDIQFILAEVLKRPPKGRGIGNTAKASSTNQMRTVCDNLRLSLQAAFSNATKEHLSAERLANSGKAFPITSNPVRDIPAIRGARRANTESLTPSELAELLRLLNTLTEPRRSIANSLIYFGGQRIKQLCATSWSAVTESTLSVWDSKGKKDMPWEHILPITPRIAEILSPLIEHKIGPGPFSFMERTTASPATVIQIFSDAGRQLSAKGKTRKFTYQHVRVTAETLMAHLGISTETRAWLLSHGRSGVQAKHYDRYAYLPEKRAALEKWGAYLDELAWGKGDAKRVVLLTKCSISDER